MSRLPFELLLALRYVRPKRTFVSIITLISVLGVMLGVAVLIIVISVMTGFDRDLRDKILGFNAHLQIVQYRPDVGDRTLMTNFSQVLDVVKANPEVKSASPFVLEQVLVETEPPAENTNITPKIWGPWLRGVDPESKDSVSMLTSNIFGSADLSGHGMLVGDTMAETLGLRIGDRLAVYSPPALEKMLKSRKKGQKSQEEELVPATDYEVRGIFDAGYYEYNANLVITSLENAQDLYELGDDVDGLMVMLKDPYQADSVKRELTARLGTSYRITTWNEENTAMQAVLVEKNVMYYILFFIVIVAAFGITCTLVTFVVLKTRDIGVLKALGASSRQVMWVFLSQSLAVSVLGVIVGVTTGTLAVIYRNNFLHAMRRLTGMELFPQKIYEFSELPAKITPLDLAIICGGSLLICLLAAAFPAWHASRLKPVEALRHE